LKFGINEDALWTEKKSNVEVMTAAGVQRVVLMKTIGQRL